MKIWFCHRCGIAQLPEEVNGEETCPDGDCAGAMEPWDEVELALKA